MQKSNQANTLLPVGEAIEHDGRPLHIEKRLSSGLTGEVYRGTWTDEENVSIPVAIKVMKTLEFPMARQLFDQESETLAFMGHLEQKTNIKQNLALKIAPFFHGRGEYNNTPYIVMEFIQGREIPDILADETTFPEPRALTAAWHLFRTLDILHTPPPLGLGKTYIDLKYENLWWIPGDTETQGQLKLTDFGTLEAVQPRGVQRDLLLASVYLFSMLTGYTLDYSLGSLRETAEPVLRRYKDQISWGTYHLLRLLLHRNGAQRPATAEKVAQELRTLVHLWGQPVENLFKTVDASLELGRKFMLEAEEDPDKRKDAHTYASRARTALDIINRMLSEEQRQEYATRIENVVYETDEILSKSDYLARGRALFLGRSYKMSREVFEKGMEWDDQPEILRRWAYAARIGEEVQTEVFDQRRDEILAALERLNEKDWPAARERLATLAQAFSSQGLDALLANVELEEQLVKAHKALDDGQFDTASAAFRRAMYALEKLIYVDFVKDIEVGDLLRKAEKADELQRTLGDARANMAAAHQMLTEGNYKEAVEKVRAAQDADRQHPEISGKLLAFLDAAIAASVPSVPFNVAGDPSLTETFTPYQE